jgi:hypothetical protein
MGCFCHNSQKKPDKPTINDRDDYLFINKKTMSQDIRHSTNPEPLVRKTVSITAGTFINEKKFNRFQEEYEIIDYIGSGKL